ncbi:glycosyltransferase family 2 protein [Bacteroides ilei]|uniref:glycosyltransferase family 2 protein n=1 Tax=Bacteroides ilei TaxID=1907658 RepID=UPI000931AEC9|nr:glycosyltransferase family 2 protein [Bacteroides ilei]
MKKVSVVILNWNGAGMLRNYLPSVIRYSQGEDVEVCVADNGSTDHSCEILEKEFPSVRLICLDRNYGFAEGYNKALAQVDAKYVVLLNSDVEVTEGWLDTLTDYMEKHPEVVACQPKLLGWRDRERFEYAGASGGFIDYYGYPFCRGRIFDVVEKDRHQYDTVIPVFWATGAALYIRLDKYREVGGLDGRFFAHMEEIDLCWRLNSRGYRLVCIPQSVVYHVGGATLKKENPRKTFLNFRNNLLMLYKNLPDEDLKPVMRMRALLDFIASMVYVAKLDFRNAKAVWNARKEFMALREQFKPDRKENLQRTVVSDIPQRYRFSILWQSKIKGRKFFSTLPG